MLTTKHLLICALILATAACAKKPVVDETQAPVTTTQAKNATGEAVAGSGGSSSPRSGAIGQTATAETDAGSGISLQSNGILETVYFDYDSHVLTVEARQVLERNAQSLRRNPAEKIVIKGHTDERGSDAYNLALGEKRARAAYNYLVALGIPAERLSIISYGEEQPAVAGNDEESWAKNRRAQF